MSVHLWKCLHPVAVAGLLAAGGTLPACSGGGGAGGGGGGVVTPLDGIWDNSAVPLERIQFTVPNTVHLFASTLNVTANVTTSADVCGGGLTAATVAVQGTVDDGRVLLRPAGSPAGATCIDGRFIDLRTLQVAADATHPQRNYQNNRVDVGMSLGLWVSQGDGRLKLKFTEPDSINNDEVVKLIGCDVSTLPANGRFSGDMSGFNTGTGAKPAAAELRDTVSTALAFRQFVFVDGATITLQNAIGQSFTLHRQAESPATICP
jgi:hypothetical protein